MGKPVTFGPAAAYSTLRRMKDVDDTEWVRACLAGDREAFRILVDRHRDAVYNLAYQMSGNATSAEDLAQETFIRAFQKLRQYKPSYSFRNWLLGICANLSRSRYRSRKRKRALEEAYATEAAIRREGRHDAEDRAESARGTVGRALMQVPESLRAPLVLHYMEGQSIREIAETLNIRLSAVKMRLARGRERLAERIREDREPGENP